MMEGKDILLKINMEFMIRNKDCLLGKQYINYLG